MLESEREIIISLPGAPKTKLRPRFSRNRKCVCTYDPQSEEKETVRWQLKARMKGRKPMKGPVSLTMIAIFKKPKSREKLDETYHIVKPDLDNLLKWLCDVGNDILWYDDKQIVKIAATKIYGEEPRTIITVSEAQ